MEPETIASILAAVLQRTELDFSSYRPPVVARRIRSRMVATRVATADEYLARVRDDPSEAPALAQQIAIRVSRFYRNAEVFDLLRDDILPALAAARAPAPLRVWSAGCGFGEEPYTLAMLLDAAGVPGAIHATDVNPMALARAAEAVYPQEALSELPAEFLQRYLEPVANAARPAYRVVSSLHERVRFQRHDLTLGRAGPGDGACDLITCRNVLIYFQPPAQQRALESVLASAGEAAIVCLGEAEWPPAALAARLRPVHPRSRIFRAVNPPPEEPGS